MCFSARISFLAVGLLVSIAIATFRKVRGANEIPLASIPLICAIQQAAEGALWLLLPNHQHPDLIALCMYAFLGIAFVVWPFFVPFSLILIENNPLRRAIMGFCLILGSAWSLASLWYLVHVGAQVDIRSCHLLYELDGFERISALRALVLYSVAVLVPFLVSSSFTLRLFGCLLGIFGLVSYLVWFVYFISIWCFFAALVSFGVYAVLCNRRHDPTLKQTAS